MVCGAFRPRSEHFCFSFSRRRNVDLFIPWRRDGCYVFLKFHLNVLRNDPTSTRRLPRVQIHGKSAQSRTRAWLLNYCRLGERERNADDVKVQIIYANRAAMSSRFSILMWQSEAVWWMSGQLEQERRSTLEMIVEIKRKQNATTVIIDVLIFLTTTKLLLLLLIVIMMII